MPDLSEMFSTEGGRLDDEQVERLVVHLRESALIDYQQRTDLSSLEPEHHQAFVHALKNVLSTEVALFTFAQIIDGLPTADVGWDRRNHRLWGDHPLESHEELCPGAMDKAREMRDLWDPATLKFNQKLVRGFRKAKKGTKAFNLRLIELVAVAIHQLAGTVFKMDLRLHKGDVDSVVSWVMPDEDDTSGFVMEAPPTIFYHPIYLADDIYPDKVADIVGYWAEDRIFGGVVVFDRRGEDRAKGNDADMPNLYLHACRRKVTNRITQLRDDQQDSILSFFSSDPPSPDSCPLPIILDDRNLVRVDNWYATIHHRIYRDVWERRPLSRHEISFLNRRPTAEVDYPGSRELLEYINTLPTFSMSFPTDPLDESRLDYDRVEADIIESVRRSRQETVPETGEKRTESLPSTSTRGRGDGSPADKTGEEEPDP